MAKYSVEDTTLTGIADAIREKTGGGEEIKVEDMAEKIGEISGGGSDGGEIETCTLTVEVPRNVLVTIYYRNAALELTSYAVNISPSTVTETLTVAKNSIVAMDAFIGSHGDNYEQINPYTVLIYGNATISLSM